MNLDNLHGIFVVRGQKNVSRVVEILYYFSTREGGEIERKRASTGVITHLGSSLIPTKMSVDGLGRIFAL